MRSPGLRSGLPRDLGRILYDDQIFPSGTVGDLFGCCVVTILS
jgi:hypothetical protein